jgi:hypothetical protein
MADLPTPFQQEMSEFLELLKLCGTSISGVLTTLGAAVPLTGFFWQAIAPPWPQASPVIPTLFSVFAIVVLFLTFRREPEADARRWSPRLWIPGLFLLLFYLLLAANYIEELDSQIHLTGWSLTPEARQALEDPKGPKNTTRDLLNYFGHDSEDRIWQGRYFLRWALLVLACLASAAIAGGISLLLIATIASQRALAAQAVSAAAQVAPAASAAAPAAAPAAQVVPAVPPAAPPATP